MFYDERIEMERGKTAKLAILLSVCLAAISFALRIVWILHNKLPRSQLWLLSLDAVILVGGGLCLLLGSLQRRSASDERALSNELAFYRGAYPYLLKLVLLVFAVFLPITGHLRREVSIPSLSFDSLLPLLFFIVLLFAITRFRRAGIFFNYSILEGEDYRRGVLRNLAAMSRFLLLLFSVSVLSGIALTFFTGGVRQPGGLGIALAFLLLEFTLDYLFLWLECTLVYLVFSVLERASYRSDRLLSRASTVTLLVTIGIQILYSGIIIAANKAPITQLKALRIASSVSPLETYITLALMLHLTYLGYEYTKERKCPLFKAGIVCILAGQVVSELLAYISSGMLYIFLRDMESSSESYRITSLFANINLSIEATASLSLLVGVSLIIIALTITGALRPTSLLALPIFIITLGVYIFLTTQTTELTLRAYRLTAKAVLLLWLALLTLLINRKVSPKRAEISIPAPDSPT